MELSCSCLYGSGLTTIRQSNNSSRVRNPAPLGCFTFFFVFLLLFCIIEVFNICFCYNWELVPFICCYCFCFFVLGNTPHTCFVFFLNFCSKWELVPFILCFCFLFFLFRNTPLTFAVLCCHFSDFFFFLSTRPWRLCPLLVCLLK